MTPEYAYRTADPAVLAAYRAAQERRHAAARALCDEAERIGKNKGPAVSGGIFGCGDRLVGLFADDPADPPEGWRYLKGRDLLLPRRGKAGDEAQAFLDRHEKIGVDPRVVLAEHGLPTESAVPMADGRYSLRKPVMFEHDGALYAKYTGEVRHELSRDIGCTWPQIPLSQFYAALETVQVAERAREAAA